jgi:hypothetical protein
MKKLNRRELLVRSTALTAGGIGLALAVEGCAEEQAVLSDATTIANGISAILPTIQTITGISNNVVNTVETGITAVKAGATALGSAIAGGATSAAQQVANGVSVVTTALSGITVPSWVTSVLQAAGTLVPLVLQVAGVALALNPAAIPSAQDATVARAILQAAAKA